ncbi:unnamed protein product [Aphis gossypii]|uniref:Uncharacterized protein n=1 Tax=Aphis gossypii TaxID=80765 RepID=A0A9P0NH56_APHGO|nr:unnamed protein product [Aphis gossypii]
MTETRVQRLGRMAAHARPTGFRDENSGRATSLVRVSDMSFSSQVPRRSSSNCRPPMPYDRMHRIGNALRPVASTPYDRSQRRLPVHGVADIRSTAITYPNLRHCCRRRRYCPTSVFRFSYSYFYIYLNVCQKKLCHPLLINITQIWL